MPIAPMNALVIMSDEHTRRMSGCYGHPQVKTPNLDRLAESGVRFDYGYCNNPICVPSRANFLTGRYVHQTGHWDNGHPYIGHEAPSWGHRLGDAGHQVTSIGKLHYRFDEDDNGLADSRVSLNVLDGKGDIFGCMRWNTEPLGFMTQNVLDAGAGECPYTRFDTAVGDEAVSWLNKEALEEAPGGGKPWALFVSFAYPHFPFIVPEEFKAMYPNESVPLPHQWDRPDWPDHPFWDDVREWRYATGGAPTDEAVVRNAVSAYFGMITFMDHQVGRVLDALEASGQSGNTRIIYTSDHGEMLGSYGLWGKSCMYEDSVGVPFIVAGPDIPAGRVSSQNVSFVDCFPSILDCVGVPLEEEDADLPGTSIWPIATGESTPDRIVFAEYHALFSTVGNYMVRDDRYKLIYYAGNKYPPNLFDLQEDPSELNDLGQYVSHPTRAARELPAGSGAGSAGDHLAGAAESSAHSAGPATSDADTDYVAIIARLEAELRKICDPEAVNQRAFADQRAMVERHGGEEVLLARGLEINFSPAPGFM